MEEESFIGAFGDVPTDLAGDYSQLFIFRTDDFCAWYRRVRDAHEREVDGGVAGMTGAWYRRVRDAYNREVGSLRDETYVDTMSDADLAEHGLVRLPVDAEGKYIHIGDVMEWCDSGETLTVEGIGSDVLFYIDGENAEWTAARNKRHHHAPTVEDVLREFADEVWNRCCEGATASDSGIDGLVAEYAAKLRLANDGEEQ